MFLQVPAYPSSPGQTAVKWLCVCVFCLPKIITSINQYHATITDRMVLWSLNTGRITMPSNWWPLPVMITRSLTHSPVWARGRCRISPPRFLAECCKRQLNQVSLVLLYFRLSAFSDLYWFCLSAFSCTVLFVSISQVIGCEDRLRNDVYCVGWCVKLYSNQTKPLTHMAKYTYKVR